jgi:hypothetical protein
MQKEKKYHQTKFSARLVRQALEKCRSLFTGKETVAITSLEGKGETWFFDSVDEFFAAYAGPTTSARIQVRWNDATLARSSTAKIRFCPLYRPKADIPTTIRMSALCQKRTFPTGRSILSRR